MLIFFSISEPEYVYKRYAYKNKTCKFGRQIIIIMFINVVIKGVSDNLQKSTYLNVSVIIKHINVRLIVLWIGDNLNLYCKSEK